jgi:uncharacterized protein (DUF58 family)
MKIWLRLFLLLVGCGLTGLTVENRGGFVSYYLFLSILAFLLYAVLLQGFSLKRLQAQHSLSGFVCLSGEALMVSVQVSFRSLLPLPWLVWHETWLHKVSGEQLHYHKLLFPWFRQSFMVHYRIIGLKRGRYVLINSEAITGDLFGFTVKKKSVLMAQTCTVYPKPVNLSQIQHLPLSGEGDRGKPPIRMQAYASGGVREYTSGDPMHRIHWKASARQGRLMTKEAEQAASAKRMLLLDAAPAALTEAAQPLLEQGIALAAAFFEAAATARESCGFASSSAGTRRIAPAIRQDLTLAYEVLASVGGKTAMSFPDLVRKEAAVLPPDTSMLCITSALDPALLRALMEAQSRGRYVRVVYVHDGAALSSALREAVLQLQASGCSFTEVPHPRSEWPGPGVIADASA